MSTSLDNQTNITAESKLFDEIRRILVSNYHDYGKASVIVYTPMEGPMAYTYEEEGFTVKDVFRGNYTKKTLKNLVNQLTREPDDFVGVSTKSLYSYSFFAKEV